MEVDAQAVEGTGMAYGLIFRVSSDGRSYYAFMVDPSGAFSLYRSDDQQKKDLLSFAQSSAVKTGKATNRLKVIAQGNQLALYLNDRWLNTVTDATYTTGRAGFILVNDDANVQAAFDNLTISKINHPLALPRGVATARPPTPTPPQPTPTLAVKYPLPPGKAGLLLRNFYPGPINYTIADKEYQLPASPKSGLYGELFIVLDPGKHTYSANIHGIGDADGTLDLQADKIFLQTWAPR
jgi:hypothetical protein